MYGDGLAVHTRFFTIAKSLVFMPVRASQCAFHPRQLRPPSDARFVNSESGARVRGSIWLRAQGCFRRSFSQEVGQMNVAWNVETTMRFSAAVIGCAATPALVALASFRWKKDIGRELPRWRNGMGLAAIVIISALWLFQTTRWVLWSIDRDLTTPYGSWREFEIFLPAFYFYAALPLACALKRASRLLTIAAWVLVQVFYMAFIST